MMNRCYLLSLEEFWGEADGERLLERARCKVDKVRRERAERMRTGKGQAACIGAGLLLQLAVQEWLASEADSSVGAEEMAVYSVSQVLELLEGPLELVMDYGERGKPYLREYPIFFNLSHSGEYVFCAISDREIGVDIQQFRPTDEFRLARRFFSEEERQALEKYLDRMEQRKMFYRLWTRKEAYGKLTGEGLAASVSRSLLPVDELPPLDMELNVQQRVEKVMSMAEVAGETSLSWQEWNLPDYRIALCQYKE